MTKPPDSIRFEAQIAKVATLVDGGIRLTLDLPETAIDAAKQLFEIKQNSPLVLVAVVPAGPSNTTVSHRGVLAGA